MPIMTMFPGIGGEEVYINPEAVQAVLPDGMGGANIYISNASLTALQVKVPPATVVHSLNAARNIGS